MTEIVHTKMSFLHFIIIFRDAIHPLAITTTGLIVLWIYIIYIYISIALSTERKCILILGRYVFIHTV